MPVQLSQFETLIVIAANANEDTKTATNGSIPNIVITAPSAEVNKTIEPEDENKKKIVQNGDVVTDETHNAEEWVSPEDKSPKCATDKGGCFFVQNLYANCGTYTLPGKSPMKKKVKTPVRSSPRKINGVQLYKKLLDFDVSDDDTEDDSTFVAGINGDYSKFKKNMSFILENSSDEESANVSVEEGSEESSDGEEAGEEEEDDEELDDDEVNLVTIGKQDLC